MDLKQLVWEYKESSRQMGVLQIRNVANGKRLIVPSVNVPATINSQTWQLKMGMHPNRELQSDWKESGSEAFAFEILDTLKPVEVPDYDPSSELAALEQLWLDKESLRRGCYSLPQAT